MKGIVDRIENGIAVVETKSGMLDLPAPDGLQDRDAAQARRAKLQERLDRMMKKK